MKRDKSPYIVYLTKDGHKPSDYSLIRGNDKLKDDVIRTISFKNDIIPWLEEIRAISTDKMKPMIDQYSMAINDFINIEKDSFMEELVNKLIENSRNLKAAIEISESINSAKSMLIKIVFDEFKKQMKPIEEKYGLMLETKSEWFHYEKEAMGFYKQKDSTYPGLNYVIKTLDQDNGISLWLRIEVAYRLFACLCVFDYKAKSNTKYEIGDQCDKISTELWTSLKEIVELPEEHKSNNCMIWWNYLPTGSGSTVDAIDTVPNFKEMNDAAWKLADKDYREKFVEQCIKVIETTLLEKVKIKS